MDISTCLVGVVASLKVTFELKYKKITLKIKLKLFGLFYFLT